ncbi:MotA/TolQ/ExbB proton channel family protein [Desulfoplanes sp.]
MIIAVFAVLTVMSITGWTIIFVKTVQFMVLSLRIKRDVRFFKKTTGPHPLAEILKRDRGSMAKTMAEKAVHEVKRQKHLHVRRIPHRDMPAKVASQTSECIKATTDRLYAGLPFLAICTNTAPLLGLFGTVWGIMRSFHAYAELKTSTLATVGPGIADALSTTAAGLMVAIPATLAYNIFLVLLNNRQRDLEYCAKHVVQTFENELHSTNPPVPPAG